MNEFLPLPVRRVLYVTAIIADVAAPFIAVTQPEYAAAAVSASGALSVAALGTALANPSRKEVTDSSSYQVPD